MDGIKDQITWSVFLLSLSRPRGAPSWGRAEEMGRCIAPLMVPGSGTMGCGHLGSHAHALRTDQNPSPAKQSINPQPARLPRARGKRKLSPTGQRDAASPELGGLPYHAPLAGISTPLSFPGSGGYSQAADPATDLFLAAAARSRCRRFLNQLPTCVGVRPVACASSRFLLGLG